MLYHIVQRRAWQTAEIAGEYRPAALTADGYIRLVTDDNLLALARRHHSGQRDLLVLAVDAERLLGRTHRADEGGLLVVHLHSALPLDAVVNIHALETTADGQFALPRALRPPQPLPAARTIYHILNRHAWQTAVIAGEYRPPSLVTEGFIHFSDRHQVLQVANTLYAKASDLMLLAVDANHPGVAAHLKQEAIPDGTQTFPHLYGALPLDAVRNSYTLGRGADGLYHLPATLPAEPPAGAGSAA